MPKAIISHLASFNITLAAKQRSSLISFIQSGQRCATPAEEDRIDALENAIANGKPRNAHEACIQHSYGRDAALDLARPGASSRGFFIRLDRMGAALENANAFFARAA